MTKKIVNNASISAVLIVKNESAKIEDCLASLAWADEIIVLDSGSSDSTCAMARAAGAKVFVREDWQGFGEQRRRAEALASQDWIFMIDADERVTPSLRDSILKAVKSGPAIYEVNRLCWCFGRYIRHSGLYPDWVPRLYPRGGAAFDSTRVHERLRNTGSLPVLRLQGHLEHLAYDSIRHQLVKSAHYAEEWALERHSRGCKTSLASAWVHGSFCFVRMYFLRKGFLDGGVGLLLAGLFAQATFIKYAQLWLLGQQEKKHE